MLGATATVLAFSNHIWNTHAYNFLVHLSGTSSTGKSTLAKAIASFGGCPEGSNGFFISFLGTMNAIVKMVTNIHGIPICIDEFSASKYQKDWSNFIYTLSNGYDKERCVAGGNSIMATASFAQYEIDKAKREKKVFDLEAIKERLNTFIGLKGYKVNEEMIDMFVERIIYRGIVNGNDEFL